MSLSNCTSCGPAYGPAEGIGCTSGVYTLISTADRTFFSCSRSEASSAPSYGATGQRNGCDVTRKTSLPAEKSARARRASPAPATL
ncbi:Uncharacterised protein [Mycobacteroides abscessus subsp. abscessus]|nr:Uncharacterised protein [Mycobacteroides abscessus subsp. abscessus]